MREIAVDHLVDHSVGLAEEGNVVALEDIVDEVVVNLHEQVFILISVDGVPDLDELNLHHVQVFLTLNQLLNNKLS